MSCCLRAKIAKSLVGGEGGGGAGQRGGSGLILNKFPVFHFYGRGAGGYFSEALVKFN